MKILFDVTLIPSIQWSMLLLHSLFLQILHLASNNLSRYVDGGIRCWEGNILLTIVVIFMSIIKFPM